VITSTAAPCWPVAACPLATAGANVSRTRIACALCEDAFDMAQGLEPSLAMIGIHAARHASADITASSYARTLQVRPRSIGRNRLAFQNLRSGKEHQIGRDAVELIQGRHHQNPHSETGGLSVAVETRHHDCSGVVAVQA
jgi:hypothetical protein